MRCTKPSAATISLGMLVVVLAACASGPNGLKGPEGSISIVEWESAQAWVLALRDVHCRDLTATDFECESASHQEKWNFTRPGDPAHPSLSTSTMVWYQTAQGQAIRIDRMGHYAGDSLAFDAWTRKLVLGDSETLRTMNELASRSDT